MGGPARGGVRCCVWIYSLMDLKLMEAGTGKRNQLLVSFLFVGFRSSPLPCVVTFFIKARVMRTLIFWVA